MKNRILLTLSSICICFICMFCLIGCFGEPELSDKEEIQIISTHMTTEYLEYLECYDAKIVGIAKNISGKDLSYVSVNFSIYDANGILLGSAYANMNNLSAGESWRFEATSLDYPSEKPVSFKLKEISSL